MKLSLTVETDTVNILALNMGRIAVDIDGIELAELIDVVNQNGYSLHVADEPGKLVVEDPLPPNTRPSPALTASSVVPPISPKLTTTCYSLFRISMKTLVTASG
ncbi:Malate transporter [Lelliottia jeotgali]